MIGPGEERKALFICIYIYFICGDKELFQRALAWKFQFSPYRIFHHPSARFGLFSIHSISSTRQSRPLYCFSSTIGCYCEFSPEGTEAQGVVENVAKCFGCHHRMREAFPEVHFIMPNEMLVFCLHFSEGEY